VVRAHEELDHPDDVAAIEIPVLSGGSGDGTSADGPGPSD
jgi:hypothetical protein